MNQQVINGFILQVLVVLSKSSSLHVEAQRSISIGAGCILEALGAVVPPDCGGYLKGWRDEDPDRVEG